MSSEEATHRSEREVAFSANFPHWELTGIFLFFNSAALDSALKITLFFPGTPVTFFTDMNPFVVVFSGLFLASSVFAQFAGQQPQPIVIQSPRLPTLLPAAQTSAPAVTTPMKGLVFDADSKEYNPKVGEAFAPFVFSLTNISTNEIVINNVTTSCGCTVAKLPEQPWHIAPGTNGEIKVTVNLAGKMGHVTKQVTVNSTAGIKSLLVNVNIPPTPPSATENARGDRNKNMELAKSDRQAVFKGDCRSCHVDKGVAKLGKELYAADCGICHDSPIRASMVPDLRAPKAPRDHNYWVNWITYGRMGSMMPAFGAKDGGPLAQEQIDSLVKYLEENFPQGSVPATTHVLPPPLPKVGGSQ